MAQGILMPFHVQTKTAMMSPLMFPIFFSWISSIPRGTFNPARCVGFFCSPQNPIDMSTYRDKFAKRMDMAGLKPHHRIAMAVSGGPDSMALCVLTAGWKTDNCDAATKGRNKLIDGLLAIIVDHGLRTESTEEANLVYNRIINMGIKCEVARCEWLDGRPKHGHLQEAARHKRYEVLQNICIQQQISVLLIAHHEDDQAELFILRLSRDSGVLGLAGMAFASQMFPKFPDYSGEASKARGILLVRPLLEFSKEDMYNMCRGGDQQWVEDPTNQSLVYARNRIRMSLNTFSASIFKSELQAVMAACQRTRSYVDKICQQLMDQAVTIMPHGYAVIDLESLHATEVKNLCLAKFASLVLQFISQRHRPIRSNALKLLLDYLHTSPCKTCLTVAGCYLCPAPGSKGTAILVCCSINSPFPLKVELFPTHCYRGQIFDLTSEIEQILKDGGSYLEKFIPDALNVPFLDVTSTDDVLVEAKRLGILSDSTCESIASLRKKESENFKSKSELISNCELKNDAKSAGAVPSRSLYPGQVGYFMDRFILNWNICNTIPYKIPQSVNEFVCDKEMGAGQCCCNSFLINDKMVAEVRHMIDTDWIYLSDLSKLTYVGDTRQPNQSAVKSKKLSGKTFLCLEYAAISAQRALESLKSIPVAARRSLPVLVSPQGLLLSIPSVGFMHCPRLMVSALFYPRIPLGGGHSSFL